jgi:hypothetical protein
MRTASPSLFWLIKTTKLLSLWWSKVHEDCFAIALLINKINQIIIVVIKQDLWTASPSLSSDWSKQIVILCYVFRKT